MLLLIMLVLAVILWVNLSESQYGELFPTVICCTFWTLKNLCLKCCLKLLILSYSSLPSDYVVNLNFVFSGIVGNSAATLLTTIEEMHLLSKKIFFNSLSLHASKLMDKVCFNIMRLSYFKTKTFISVLSSKSIRWIAVLDFSFSQNQLCCVYILEKGYR